MISLRHIRGFTLIELLVTIALFAIVSSLAVPSVKTLIANQAVSSTASDLLTDVMQTRSLAMAKNSQSVIESVDDDWGKGWTIYLDKDDNGTFTEGTDTLVITKAPIVKPVKIDTEKTNKVRFIYQPSGVLAGLANGTVAFASDNSTRQRRVVIEKSGRPRICNPDQQSC